MKIFFSFNYQKVQVAGTDVSIYGSMIPHIDLGLADLDLLKFSEIYTTIIIYAIHVTCQNLTIKTIGLDLY